MNAIARAFFVVVLMFAGLTNLHAESTSVRDLPPGLQIPDAARPGPNFDVDRATDAYLNLLTPAQRASSDAYFEGGYWLQLWGLLYGFAVAAIFLCSGLSRRLRDFARRREAGGNPAQPHDHLERTPARYGVLQRDRAGMA